MTTVLPETERPNGGRRTGATWVAATGAFLLLAAAAVFVATRWSAIPDSAKLAMLVAITGACILGGDRVRRTLPATGNALFHVGALMVPIDGVALGLRTELSWPSLLLVNSAIAVVVLTICAQRVGSVVLAAAASAAVIATATGVAAISPLPASFVLASFALGACFVKRVERHAFVWASVAAIAPLSILALDGIVTGQGVANDLGGLAVSWPWSIATAGLVTVVVLRGAQLRREPALALIALGGWVAHGIAAWNDAQVPEFVAILAPAALFLLAELIILAVRRDPFWGKPTDVAGRVLEVIAAVPTLIAILAGIVFVHFGWQETSWALAAAVTTLAWIVAERRRLTQSATRAVCLAGAAAAASFGLAAATGSALVVAGGALTIALLSVFVIDRTRCALVAYCAAMYSTWVVMTEPRFAFAGGLAAAAVIAVAVFWSRGDNVERATGLYLALLALGLGFVGGAAVTPPLLMMLAWPIVAWGLAVLAERTRIGSEHAMRALAFGVLLSFGDVPTIEAVVTCAVLAGMCAADALRTRLVPLAYLAIAPLVYGEAIAVMLSGFEPGIGGVVLCAGASVFLGSAACVRDPWRAPLAAAAAATATLGLIAATPTPETFGAALMIVGVLVLATGLVVEKNEVSFAGGGAATLGFWMVLGANHVMISELYLAPVAVMLLIGGALLRMNPATRPSSWVAYGPAIAMLAASGIAERIGGGSAYHSLFAGAVGVAAVAFGGWRRSLAPLLLGTATLVIVVAREAFDSGAGIPTWAWLAAGGVALIGSAVAMERNDVSPIEAGRRLVDVMGAQFD